MNNLFAWVVQERDRVASPNCTALTTYEYGINFVLFLGVVWQMVVVCCGCETWLLTLREERRLKVCENRVLRRIFGLKKDEVTREWRKLHNEGLNELYSSPNIVRVIKSKRM